MDSIHGPTIEPPAHPIDEDDSILLNHLALVSKGIAFVSDEGPVFTPTGVSD